MYFKDKELEHELLEVGDKLVYPPSSVDELLLFLDQVESCLSKVKHRPSGPMLNALSPIFEALIADKLARHSDVDVKVAVASCLSEIIRITAPEPPYNDDQLKVALRLIVSSFENLIEKSSRSYKKRTSILKTVSKVRLCVLMLDLECDALILEMFQNFLKTIREDDPDNVFSSMEDIMIIVLLEQSEDKSVECFSPILASAKKNNKEFLPIAQKLGESVLKGFARLNNTFLRQAMNILGYSLDDYSYVLASLCNGIVVQNDDDECKSAEEPMEESAQVDESKSAEEPVEESAQDDECKSAQVEESAQVDESKSAEDPVEESAQVVSKNTKDVPPPQQDNPIGDRSPKSVMTNGIAQAGEEEALADSKSLKKQDGVVMLDLECDALILEMFQHFLKTIREDHPENVFSSMETIMIHVLEEREDISLELLSPILASVKKNNKDFLPIAQKLGERVLESCAAKIKPYLVQAVNILGISLEDYNDVLASICQDASGNVEQNDVCATSDHADDECKSAQVEESAQVDESKSAEDPVEESAQVVSENTKDVPPPQQDNPIEDRSPKSAMTNGIAQAGEDEALAYSKSLKKLDGTDSSILSKSNDLPANEEHNDDLNPEKVDSVWCRSLCGCFFGALKE